MARNLLTRRDMTSPTFEEVAAPAWAIRPEEPVDLDQIHDLHAEAFGRPDEAELVDAIRSGPDFIADLSLVAVATDGSVLGHVLVSRIGFEEDASSAGRRDVLSLGPLGVLPAHGARGIGTALVAEALARTDRRHEPFVFLLGSPTFYGPFGFEPAADHGITSPYADAGPAFQVRARPGGPAPVPGTVVYPPMFELLPVP